MYTVSTPVSSVQETLKPVIDRLRKDHTAMSRMIIYGCLYDVCADIYLFFKSQLGEQFTEPIDAPDITGYQLVDMFTSVTDPMHKDHILRTFAKESCLRIVIATIAFALGLDCPNIRQIVHVDLPDDIESYIQHTGWAGRDGQPLLAILLHIKGGGRRILDYNMKEYGQRLDLLV